MKHSRILCEDSSSSAGPNLGPDSPSEVEASNEGDKEEEEGEKCDELKEGIGGLNEGLRDLARIGGLSSTGLETGGSASTQLVPSGETSALKQKGESHGSHFVLWCLNT